MSQSPIDLLPPIVAAFRGKIDLVFVGGYPPCLQETMLQFLSTSAIFQSHHATAWRDSCALPSNPAVRLCCANLDRLDIDQSAKDTLSRFSDRVAFLGLVHCSTYRRCFAFAQAGACQLIDCDTGLIRLRGSIESVCLARLINPHGKRAEPVIRRAAKILLREDPSTVSSWAHKMDCDESYLRRAWAARYRTSPKQILTIHAMYREAFRLDRLAHGLPANTRSIRRFTRPQIAYCSSARQLLSTH